MFRTLFAAVIVLLVAFVLAGCGAKPAAASAGNAGEVEEAGGAIDSDFVLRTGMVEGRMAFVGVGGAIDGLVNPDLPVKPGATVRMTIVNGHMMAHDLEVPDLHVKSRLITGNGASESIRFVVPSDAAGILEYICTVSGHRQAGMVGRLVVEPVAG